MLRERVIDHGKMGEFLLRQRLDSEDFMEIRYHLLHVFVPAVVLLVLHIYICIMSYI